MTTLRLLATYEGWIFSASGNTVRKKNGTTRRVKDLHYDQWSWLMPLYNRVAIEFAGDKRLVAIHSAVALGDIEMAGELCGKIIQNQNYACENQSHSSGESGPDGLFQIKRPQNHLPDNYLSTI